MTASECIKRMEFLDKAIDVKLRHAVSLREALTDTSAPSLTADSVMHAKKVDKMQEMIAAVIDIENMADQMIDELTSIKGKLVKAIAQLDDPLEALFLTERYLGGQKTVDMAITHSMTQRNVQLIISRGLKNLKIT